jgi:hypothetical protein
MFMSETGNFSFVELKILKREGGKIDISAHQAAWLARHAAGNVFIAVRDSSLRILVYAGRHSSDLRIHRSDAVAPVGVFEEPYAWEAFFELTCPL